MNITGCDHDNSNTCQELQVEKESYKNNTLLSSGRLSVEMEGVCGEGPLLLSNSCHVRISSACQKLLLRGLACLILYSCEISIDTFCSHSLSPLAYLRALYLSVIWRAKDREAWTNTPILKYSTTEYSDLEHFTSLTILNLASYVSRYLSDS